VLAAHPDELLRSPPLRRYRWMLEELRVSFFAQSLGTAEPVSAKRLAQQWDRFETWRRENPR
jgi:ATP-dependent helicase HrpA